MRCECWCGRALLVVVALGVSACGFRFLESYDAAIESGISDYHRGTIDYLSRIIQSPSAPENTRRRRRRPITPPPRRSSPISSCADTDSGPKCLPNQLTSLEAFVQKSVANATKGGANAAPADVDLSAGTCTGVALRVMQADYKRMQAMHERRKRLGRSWRSSGPTLPTIPPVWR